MISYDFYLSYSYLLLHLIGLSLVQVYLETDMIAFFFICESDFKHVAVLCPLVNRRFSGPCLGYYKRCYSAHWVLVCCALTVKSGTAGPFASCGFTVESTFVLFSLVAVTIDILPHHGRVPFS